MASLNLLSARSQSQFRRHPIINLVGLFLCLGSIAVTFQFVSGFQPILNNAENIAMQQRERLAQRQKEQQLNQRRKKAQRQQNAFLSVQKSVKDEVNALAALLKHTRKYLKETRIDLNRQRLQVTALYNNIPQTEALKVWLNQHWRNPEIEEAFHQQLLPEQRVSLTLQRSRS